ncbi:MAG TPA: DUF4129 domain-containing protein [Thermoanaerobaculia bacterium]
MRRALALALLLVATTVSALPVADYVAALERMDALLAAKQLAGAQSEARALLGAEVTWAKGKFRADETLLRAIVSARSAEGAHRGRLLATIVELRRATGMESAGGDRKLLAQIAAEQQVPELPQGGVIPTTVDEEIPMLERIARAISDTLEWIGKQLSRLLEWLLDLLPRRMAVDGGNPVSRWIVFAIVGAIVLIVVLLAVNVLRRSRAAAKDAIETSAPLGSRADEDPLSRGATEWERYAAQLAAAGKFREAIRAWYHAVLVTCYAAGILHFRKGRTNWEYVASLAPALDWRPEMIELTRRFEREWYGSLHSTPDALDECSVRAQQILGTLRGGA